MSTNVHDTDTGEGTVIAPRPATSHVILNEPQRVQPTRRRWARWPIAPWRFVIATTAVLAAIPVGIAAAEPIINGADLAVFILLAAFVAAFTLPGKDLES